MTQNGRVRLRDRDVAWHELDGEIVCLDMARSQYVAINAAGTALWRMLVGGAEVAALEQQLVTQFEIDRERASADVHTFLDGLRQRDLLEP